MKLLCSLILFALSAELAFSDSEVTYTLEEGTVTVHSCDKPKYHESPMPSELIEWEVYPFPDGSEKVQIVGRFPSAINETPFELVYAQSKTGAYYQFPLITTPDFTSSLDFDQTHGTFTFFAEREAMDEIVLKFHYKVFGRCADDVYIYSASPSAGDT